MNAIVSKYPGYKVTKAGKVWSDKSQKFLKPWARQGYLLVKVSVNGQEKTVSVHRLILESFVGPCPLGHECLHLNGNAVDNRLSNLKWGTPKENAAHKFEHGSLHKKLTARQIKHIRRISKSKSQYAIAKHFGINQSTVSRILSGMIWSIRV